MHIFSHENMHEKVRKIFLSYQSRRFIVYFLMCLLLSTLTLLHGDIAQLARAPALQAGGQGFDSLYLHHTVYS